MKKLLLVLAALAALLVTVALSASAGSVASSGERADSVRFVLNFGDPNDPTIGDVVYCGVAPGSDPFRFDLAVSNPPALADPSDPTSPKLASHDGAGWLGVVLQGRSPRDIGTPGVGERGIEFNVPRNDSFSVGLTLGGVPGVDQIVQLTSIPAGDPDGSGAGFRGIATVLAQPKTVDPFDGDGRTDNYCVSIGPGGEFAEGAISTTMPVRDTWVLDGNGADGGVLLGFPH